MIYNITTFYEQLLDSLVWREFLQYQKVPIQSKCNCKTKNDPMSLELWIANRTVQDYLRTIASLPIVEAKLSNGPSNVYMYAVQWDKVA